MLAAIVLAALAVDGGPTDAGHPRDAGHAVDGGHGSDAGRVDAGTADAGPPRYSDGGALSTSPHDFIDVVKPLYDVLACHDAGAPYGLDQKTIDAYCSQQLPRVEGYQKHWGTTAKEFLS